MSISKDAMTQLVIVWTLPATFFDEVAQDFDYAALATKYFLPEITQGETGINQLSYWFGLNGSKPFPANGGQMSTPVAWFKAGVTFEPLPDGSFVANLGAGEFAPWLIAAFAGAAFLVVKK